MASSTTTQPTTVIGVTTDGVQVFSTGLDAKGRRVTSQATTTTTGLLDDGTTWILIPA